MKRIAILEYSFMLDENVPWRTYNQFEASLEEFFKSINIGAELIDVKGNSERKIYYIERKDSVLQPPVAPSPKPMTFKKPTGVK